MGRGHMACPKSRESVCLTGSFISYQCMHIVFVITPCNFLLGKQFKPTQVGDRGYDKCAIFKSQISCHPVGKTLARLLRAHVVGYCYRHWASIGCNELYVITNRQ